MEQRPKRRRKQDNPYYLQYCEKTKEYKVFFKDGRGKNQSVSISSTIYQILNDFELDDLSELNEFDRHIEHSEVYEETIHNRIVDKPMELEDYVIQKATFEELHNAIKQLPEIQQRRIKMYYFDEMTQQEIANKESVDIRAIQYSLKCAIDNLKKIIKN